MFRLHVLQARYGDCLLLEFGTDAEPHYVLVDGGPPRTYENHLRAELQRMATRQEAETLALDLVVLSHVDNDHIVGLLDLTSELREQRARSEAEIVGIGALWHNAFEDTIGRGNDVEARLASAMAGASQATMSLTSTGIAIQGIGEGRQLRRDALLLGVPLNEGFDGGLVSVDTAPPTIELGDLALQVVGPTEDNLEELRDKWEKWL
ncbi:MAG: MBL fold metallo-hydrolase, partial [Anaerolineae bacterium]